MPISKTYRRVLAVACVVLVGSAMALGMWGSRIKETWPISARTGIKSQAGDASIAGTEGVPSAARLVFTAPNDEGYPQLTRQQLEAYLEQEGRSAASLLTAHILSNGETSLLQEAAERYPENPRVSATMLMRGGDLGGLSEEWIRRMQENDPKNSLGWCQAALSAFKEGSEEEALSALKAAASRGRPYMYHEEFAREIVKAYKSAGYHSLQAETLAATRLEVQYLPLLIDIAMEVGANPESARGPAGVEMLALSDSLRKATDRGMLMGRIAAYMIDTHLLGSMELSDEAPGSDVLALERLEKNGTESRELFALMEHARQLVPSLSDTEVKQFLRRIAVEGEIKALQWVVQMKAKESRWQN